MTSVTIYNIIIGVKTEQLVVAARLVLYQSEVCRVPRSGRAIRVRAGLAWVTHGGRDIIAREGDTVSLGASGGFALASSIDETPLVLEILTNRARGRTRVEGIVMTAPVPDGGR